MPNRLEESLRKTERRKQGSYEQRSCHRDSKGHPLFINRLIREDSPYLLQHAHNPVDWFAWGAEAFSLARREDRPVFLSIGYSTCHWCHVMEAESFDNVEIARLLNESFVSIKLDREQYPDIDEYYMTGVQLISGQGGWPMSNFLLPDGRPFYAATYFPPAQFADLLKRIAQIWQQSRGELEQSAEQTATGIQRILQGRQEVRSLDMESVMLATDRMLEREDLRYGGLAGAPKFPQEPLLFYFLDEVERTRSLRKMAFLDRALTGMARGGLYDQVGGGFHRYSTDMQWLVPHFEKMLYNQSQLSLIYLLAWRLTGKRFFLRIVRQTLDYVLREMQHAAGGFYSATDADSEDQEGRFFIWTLDQLGEVLEADELQLVERLYGPTPIGNFEAANILALQVPLEDQPDLKGFEKLESPLDSVLEKLLVARQQRVAPLRDDKLIVAWSAAMASSLAWAGWELGEAGYLEAAERAVASIREHNWRDRTLYRIYLNGEASVPAQLEDYASYCEALITLFDITEKDEYLSQAAALMEQLLTLFWNNESGGFYLGPVHAGGPALVRSSSAADGATVAAYGVTVQCLAMLLERKYRLAGAALEHLAGYQERLQQAINAVSAELDEFPPGHVTLLRAIRQHLDGSRRPVRYAGEGRLRLAMRRVSGDERGNESDQGGIEVKVTLSTLAGYQLTTDPSPDDQRVPLELQPSKDEVHWDIERVEEQRPQALDAGSEGAADIGECLELKARLVPVGDEPADLLAASAGVHIRVQLCSDRICLAPEGFTFRV